MTKKEFYKIIRFKTGEIVICTMDRDITNTALETRLTLINPVFAITSQEIRRKNGDVYSESYILRPWLDLSNASRHTISLEMVMVVADLKEEYITLYTDYIQEKNRVNAILQKHQEKALQEKAINDLLLSLSTNGEVHFIEDTE